MPVINIYDAKSRFSKLIARAEAGEQIVIARHGRPVAQLGPFTASSRPLVFGDLKGDIDIADDFDDWTDQDEQDWFGE